MDTFTVPIPLDTEKQQYAVDMSRAFFSDYFELILPILILYPIFCFLLFIFSFMVNKSLEQFLKMILYSVLVALTSLLFILIPRMAPEWYLSSTTHWHSALLVTTATVVNDDKEIQRDITQRLASQGITVDCSQVNNQEHFVCGGLGPAPRIADKTSLLWDIDYHDNSQMKCTPLYGVNRDSENVELFFSVCGSPRDSEFRLTVSTENSEEAFTYHCS